MESNQERSWKASLFGCLNDRNICLYGCFCCCCLYGKNIAKMFNQKQWWPYCIRYSISSLFACCCLFHIVSRNQFRERYGLERSFSQDCCITCCCSCCANCQEAREMKIRGYSPPPLIVIHPPTVTSLTNYGESEGTTNKPMIENFV